ncbi:MAG: DUF1292 domain-containing protein, partial [Clostridia bacterium]|nr:DUF1292 domain-containing protein [Clostridia bacterium]
TYVALVPLEGEQEEYVILKVEEDENGEEFLVTIDDDDEFDEVADIFEERLQDIFEIDVVEADVIPEEE